MVTTRQHDRRVRRQARFLLESLDDRLVLSAGGSATAEAVVHHPVANYDHYVQPHVNGHYTRRRKVLGHGSPATLPANVSAALRSLYREYKDQGGGSGSALGLPGGKPLQINGARVAVLIKVAFPPALDAYLPHLRADGLKVIRTSPDYGLAEGMLPVVALPAVAHQAAHVWPAPGPITR
jgi:hypothetical protein